MDCSREPATSQKVSIGVFIALTLAVSLVFSGALHNGFVDWDDNEYLTDNALIRSLDAEHLREMLVTLKPVYWHPVTWVSHALDYRLYGLNPTGHHFTSIFIHGLNAFWVFLLFRRLLEKVLAGQSDRATVQWVSAGAALLFALHPLRVESVVWAAERKDLLCAFFLFPAVLAYLRYAEATKADERRSAFLAVLGLFVLALMSKPMAVTLPVVLLLLDAYPLGRWTRLAQTWERIREKVPLFALSLICGVVTMLAQKQAGAMVPVDALSLSSRLLNAMHSALFYVWKTLWPVSLSPLYPFPQQDFRLLLVAALFVLATILLVVLWRRGIRAPLTVWLIYLVTVAPVIGIVQVGPQAAADRFTYIPTVGFYLLLAAGLLKIWRRVSRGPRALPGRGAMVLLSVGLLVGAAWGTVEQIPAWKNSGTLWTRAVTLYPHRMASAHFNLGRYLRLQNQPGPALRQLRIALEINSEHVDALNDIGLIRLAERRYDEAEALFRAALAVKNDPVVLNNLGLRYLETGQLETARSWFEQALKARPDYVEAYNNLGLLSAKQKRWEEAETNYRRAISLDYDFFPAHANLGNLYLAQNRLNRAGSEFMIALYLQPGNPDLHLLLGEVYLQAGNPVKAEQEFREALRLNPRHAGAARRLQILATTLPAN